MSWLLIRTNVSSQRGLTWVPAWALRCQVPSRLLGVFAGAGSSVLTLSYTFTPLLSFIIIILAKHQVHPRHRLPGDAGRASGWRRPRLLDKNKNKTFGGDDWQVGWFNIVQLCCSRFQMTVAHQDERRELSGRQGNSIWAVDPQQVVGRHVQVMVPMGGGKHAHLKEQRQTPWRVWNHNNTT